MDQFFHIFLYMHLIDLLCCESWALVLFYSSLKQLRIQTSRVVCAFKYFAYQPRTGWAQKWVHRLMTIILSNLNRLKFFFHWKTPPHLKYVATLPCNLSLMACFADINVSRGSVATYARHSVIFNIHLTTNLSMNLPVNFFFKSVQIWLNYGWESVAPLFSAHPLCHSQDTDTIAHINLHVCKIL